MSDFETFWKAYPKREGSNPKFLAHRKWNVAVKGGADPSAIIDGAKAYALQESRNIGTRFIAQSATWLNQRRWEDYDPPLLKGRSIADADQIAARHGYEWNGEKYVKLEAAE